jgi:hypothetical protein
MALLNSSFEQGGPRPGQANHWSLRTFVAKERIAGFGPDPLQAWEDFERWYPLQTEFETGDPVRAFFGFPAQGLEDFEQGWSNAHYQWEFPLGQSEACLFGGTACEDFNSGWDNDGFAGFWEAFPSATGLFDGEPVEDFEELWANNQAFAWTWESAQSKVALFDSENDVEDFHGAWSLAASI